MLLVGYVPGAGSATGRGVGRPRKNASAGSTPAPAPLPAVPAPPLPTSSTSAIPSSSTSGLKIRLNLKRRSSPEHLDDNAVEPSSVFDEIPGGSPRLARPIRPLHVSRRDRRVVESS